MMTKLIIKSIFLSIILLLCSCSLRYFNGQQITTDWQKINTNTVIKKDNDLLQISTNNFSFAGITYQLPTKTNYQINFEIKKNSGLSKFCTIILPAGKQNFALSLGLLNDTIVGIGNINNTSADQNYSTRVISLDNDWHLVKINAYKNSITIDIANRQIKLNLTKDKLQLPKVYEKFIPLSFITNKSFALRNLKIKVF